MFIAVHPKLPMRDQQSTREFYIRRLGFKQYGSDYPDYLMLEKDGLQLHFFEFKTLDPMENYGQVYIRVSHIEEVYKTITEKGIPIQEAGRLQVKPWGVKEFSLLDPDHNLLTFGEII